MDNITTSKSISVEELKDESNLIIYIAGLILMMQGRIRRGGGGGGEWGHAPPPPPKNRIHVYF